MQGLGHFNLPHLLVAVAACGILAIVAIIVGVIVGLVRKDAHCKGKSR